MLSASRVANSSFVAVVTMFALVVGDARAQSVSDEEVAKIIPAKGRQDEPIVRHRWRYGPPINVVVITDGQRDPCVGAAIRQIQNEVDALRREVPALKIAPRVVVSDWVPDRYDAPMLLIALPMENKRIARALMRFAREANPEAKFFGTPDNHGMSHGIGRADDPPDAGVVSFWERERVQGIQNDFIVHGHSWAVNNRGMEYHTGKCGWLWSVSLLELLGADHLNISYKWTKAMEARGFKRSAQVMQRLFLRALYSNRDASIGLETLRKKFQALISEPNALPVLYESDK